MDMAITLTTEQDRIEWRHLQAPLGEPRSGFTRYAAAMYFHGRGQIDGATLEAYRIVAKRDDSAPELAPREALQFRQPGENSA